MNLRRLEHALAVAEHQSFTTAAERIGISQPALSRSIKGLEDDLGLVIFLREGQQVVPTPAGRELLASAHSLINQAERLKNFAGQLAHGQAGRVRIGLGPMFKPLIEPLIEECWSADYPVDVQFYTLPVERLVARLLSEELDFFVADGRAAFGKAAIAIEELGAVPVGYFVGKKHPLLNKRQIPTRELGFFPQVTPNLPAARLEGGEGVNEVNAHGAGRISCEDIEVLVRLVQKSDAVLLAAEPAIREFTGSGTLVRLDVAELTSWELRIVLASRNGRRPTALAVRYADALKKLIRERWIRS